MGESKVDPVVQRIPVLRDARPARTTHIRLVQRAEAQTHAHLHLIHLIGDKGGNRPPCSQR